MISVGKIDFVNALSRIVSIPERGIMDRVHITAEKDTISFYAANSNAYAVLNIPCFCTEDVSVSVDTGDLKKLLKIKGGDELTIRFESDTMSVRTPKKDMTIITGPSVGSPCSNANRHDLIMEIDPDVMIDVFCKLDKLRSSKVGSSMRGFHINTTCGEIVAINGCQIGAYSIPHSANKSDTAITIEPVSKLIKTIFAKTYGCIGVFDCGKMVSFESDGNRLCVATVDTPYPSYQKILDDAFKYCDYKYTVDVKSLCNVTSEYKSIVGKSDKKPMVISYHCGLLSTGIVTDSYKTADTLEDAKVESTKDFCAGFDPYMLTDSLGLFKGDITVCGRYNVTTPIGITGGRYRSLVLPVHVKEDAYPVQYVQGYQESL